MFFKTSTDEAPRDATHAHVFFISQHQKGTSLRWKLTVPRARGRKFNQKTSFAQQSQKTCCPQKDLQAVNSVAADN